MASSEESKALRDQLAAIGIKVPATRLEPLIVHMLGDTDLVLEAFLMDPRPGWLVKDGWIKQHKGEPHSSC